MSIVQNLKADEKLRKEQLKLNQYVLKYLCVTTGALDF